MISIITPCYNDNHVVDKAIRSCLNQKYSGEYEIIVVDDGSDEPLKIENERVKLIRHRSNKGLSEALNTAVRHSVGDHIVICSADDELHYAYLERMSSYVNEADIVSCDFLAGGRHVRCGPGSLEKLMQGNCHSYAALFSRSIFDKNGGFKSYMNPSWEDYEFWLNSAKNGAKWHHIHIPLHKYNRNPRGRDAISQGKDVLLRSKLSGAHQDLYGKGSGIVTFIIPCYKHEEWINFAIESCYDQIYPHVEVIVVNDGSMHPYEFKSCIDDNRVTIINQKNKGLSSARNAGIDLALKRGSEFMVMLDSDDTVDREYVEECMSFFPLDDKKYVYSDVQFIGDANHLHESEEYECHLLINKHLHACTFLAKSDMYQDLINIRGYAYDESMKKGYEDWEIALAFLKNGWCGKRLRKYLFNYRYHQNGSMRTEASKINSELVGTIRQKHPWVNNKESVIMMCSSCGGGSGRYTNKYIKGGKMSVTINIPGIGEVDGDVPISVRYTGNTTSTMTKIGPSGTVYKYSAKIKAPGVTFPNVFTAFARDANVFSGKFVITLVPSIEVSPINISHVDQEQVVANPETAVKNILVPDKSILSEEKIADNGNKEPEYPPDDFTLIAGIGPSREKILKDKGYKYFEEIFEMTDKKLSEVLNIRLSAASDIISSAGELLKELLS